MPGHVKQGKRLTDLTVDALRDCHDSRSGVGKSGLTLSGQKADKEKDDQ